MEVEWAGIPCRVTKAVSDSSWHEMQEVWLQRWCFHSPSLLPTPLLHCNQSPQLLSPNKTVNSDLSAVIPPSFCFCRHFSIPFSIVFLRDLWKLTLWTRHWREFLPQSAIGTKGPLWNNLSVQESTKIPLSPVIQARRDSSVFSFYTSHNMIYHLLTTRVLQRNTTNKKFWER